MKKKKYVIVILDTTPKAEKSIKEVPTWKQ